MLLCFLNSRKFHNYLKRAPNLFKKSSCIIYVQCIAHFVSFFRYVANAKQDAINIGKRIIVFCFIYDSEYQQWPVRYFLWESHKRLLSAVLRTWLDVSKILLNSIKKPSYSSIHFPTSLLTQELWFQVNCLDIAPNNIATVTSVSNTASTLTGIISPYLVGLLTPDVSFCITFT